MRTAIAVLVLALPAIGDVAFRESCTYEALRPRDPFEKITYFAKDKVRVEESETATCTIFRLDRGLVWLLAAKSMSCMEMPLSAAAATSAAEIAIAKKNLEQAKAKIEKEIAEKKEALAKKEMDPESKAGIDAEIKTLEERLANVVTALQAGKPIAWCEATAEKLEVLGHPTVKWKVYVNGFLTQEAWVSDPFKGVEEYRKLVVAMYQKYNVENDEAVMQKALLRDTKGMPLKRRLLLEHGGKAGDARPSKMDVWLVSEVTEVSFNAVASSLFEVPPEFKKR